MAHSHERGISRVTFVDRILSAGQVSFRVESSPFASARRMSREARFHARDEGQSLKIIKIKFPSPSRRGGTSEIVAVRRVEKSSRAPRAWNSRSLNTLGGSVLISISLTPRRASSIVQRFVHTSN